MPLRRNLSYLLSLLPACAAIWANLHGGVWAWTNIVFSFGVLGIAEIFSPSVKSNAHSNPKDSLPEFILMLHLVLHLAVLASLFYGFQNNILQGGYLIVAAIGTGAATGSGAIIVAHELIHKASNSKQFLGKLLLTFSGNFYFFVHHLRIHHRYVGTPADAATARYNESLYHFIIRSIGGQIAEAWASEKLRLSKKNQAAFSAGNIIVQNIFLQLCIYLILGLVFGWIGALIWLIVTGFANILLEYVNYIEHYGLVRPDAVRMNDNYSWNCDKVISRFFLVDLSRHADHHEFPSKPYHILNSTPNSPVLPAGYASMVLPALIPPLWKAIVHPKLKQYLQTQR
jgi:alkane 1-monooxygenase